MIEKGSMEAVVVRLDATVTLSKITDSIRTKTGEKSNTGINKQQWSTDMMIVRQTRVASAAASSGDPSPLVPSQKRV